MSTNTTTSDASSSPLLGQGLMQVSGDFLGSFKLTDVIKGMTYYEGSKEELYEFINNVEEMLMLIRGADQTPQGLMALRAVRNKIRGEANVALLRTSTRLNWDDIKARLIEESAD